KVRKRMSCWAITFTPQPLSAVLSQRSVASVVKEFERAGSTNATSNASSRDLSVMTSSPWTADASNLDPASSPLTSGTAGWITLLHQSGKPPYLTGCERGTPGPETPRGGSADWGGRG